VQTVRTSTTALWTILTLACSGGGDEQATAGEGPGGTTAVASTTAMSGPGTTTEAMTTTSSTSTTTSGSSSTGSTGGDTGSTTTGETTDTTSPVDTSDASTSTSASDTSDTSGSSSTGDETPFDGDGADGEVCGLIMQKCVYSCMNLMWPCVDGCIAEGSPNGAAEAQALVDCAYVDCNYDSNCYTSFCLDEWYTCVSGPLTCEQEVACIQQCGDDDDECLARCYYEATDDAQKDYDSLEFCRMNEGCAELDDQCMKEFCTWNYMQCFGWP